MSVFCSRVCVFAIQILYLDFFYHNILFENKENLQLISPGLSSRQAFRVVFQQAIERSEANDEVRLRVNALIDTITYSVFLYTTRGLFEKDKLIFAAQMTFQASQARRCAGIKVSIRLSI